MSDFHSGKCWISAVENIGLLTVEDIKCTTVEGIRFTTGEDIGFPSVEYDGFTTVKDIRFTTVENVKFPQQNIGLPTVCYDWGLCQGPSHGGSYMDKGMSHIRIRLPPHIVSGDRLASVSCLLDCLLLCV